MVSHKYDLQSIRRVVADTAATAGLKGEMHVNLVQLQRRFEHEERVRKQRNRRRYPQWALYATWITAVLYIGGCTWLILVFGLKFDRDNVQDDGGALTGSALNSDWAVSTRWLMTAMLATMQDWAVNKPFSVFISTLVSLAVGEAAAVGLEFCVESSGGGTGS